MMRNLTAAQKRYLFVGHVIIPAVINITISAVIGLVTFRNADHVPVWQMDQGAFGDTLGTCFLLPLITGLIATPLVRRDVRRGVVARLVDGQLPPVLRILQRPLLPRSVLSGAMAMLITGPFVAASYFLSGLTIIPLGGFIAIKCGFAAVLGFIVSPVLALVTMAE